MNRKNIYEKRYIADILLIMVLVCVLTVPVNVYAKENPNRISRQTFKNTGITSLTIGPDVNEIEPGAFNNLHYLSNFIVDPMNENFIAINGCLYSKDKSTLICFPQGLSSSYIPNSCKKLAPGCLAGKSASLRRQVKAAITANNKGEYPKDYPGYDIDDYDEYDRFNDPTIPNSLKKEVDIDNQ